MKKIELSAIQVPKEDIFNEFLFKKENPELYEKYLVAQTTDSNIKIIKDWISRWVSRSINCPKWDEKLKMERPTKSPDMEIHRQYARVMNAFDAEKDGWVKIENADFDNLMKWWESKDGGMSVHKDSAILLNSIDEALQIARSKKGNPE